MIKQLKQISEIITEYREKGFIVTHDSSYVEMKHPRYGNYFINSSMMKKAGKKISVEKSKNESAAGYDYRGEDSYYYRADWFENQIDDFIPESLFEL